MRFQISLPTYSSLRRMPAPSLTPDDIVIADNLSSHKVAGVREAIEARGASLWFLPAYSPDLNPIEQVFAKLKELLRAEAQRTVEALWSAVGRLLDRFTSAECANYLAHAGYRYSGQKRSSAARQRRRWRPVQLARLILASRTVF